MVRKFMISAATSSIAVLAGSATAFFAQQYGISRRSEGRK